MNERGIRSPVSVRLDEHDIPPVSKYTREAVGDGAKRIRCSTASPVPVFWHVTVGWVARVNTWVMPRLPRFCTASKSRYRLFAFAAGDCEPPKIELNG